MTKSNTIKVWVEEFNDKNASILPSLPDLTNSVVEISTEKLVNNLYTFLESFNNSIENHKFNSKNYDIESIELNFGVNAKGGVELIGKLSSSVSSSIKVKISKKS